MTNLSRFTPSETLLLTEGPFPTLRQFLKLTFIDLLAKQVIRTESSLGPALKDHSSNEDKYVVPGKNYYNYRSLPHEAMFIRVIEKYPNTKLLFRHMVQLSYKYAGSKNKYIRQLCKAPAMDGLVRQNFFQRLNGNVRLTPAGEQMKQQLLTELNELEETLPSLAQTDREAVTNIASRINGNIFLLASIPLTQWAFIDDQLLAQLNRSTLDKKEDVGEFAAGCSGCGTWDSYNDYSTSFDSGCGGSTGDGGSGCSGGDSGCGGSGCGGGCGGGD